MLDQKDLIMLTKPYDTVKDIVHDYVDLLTSEYWADRENVDGDQIMESLRDALDEFSERTVIDERSA
jgi:hypothetical protein